MSMTTFEAAAAVIQPCETTLRFRQREESHQPTYSIISKMTLLSSLLHVTNFRNPFLRYAQGVAHTLNLTSM